TQQADLEFGEERLAFPEAADPADGLGSWDREQPGHCVGDLADGGQGFGCGAGAEFVHGCPPGRAGFIPTIPPPTRRRESHDERAEEAELRWTRYAEGIWLIQARFMVQS